jgi:hypothetical protein
MLSVSLLSHLNAFGVDGLGHFPEVLVHGLLAGKGRVLAKLGAILVQPAGQQYGANKPTQGKHSPFRGRWLTSYKPQRQWLGRCSTTAQRWDCG